MYLCVWGAGGGCGWFGLLLFKRVVWICLIFAWLFYCDLLVCFVYDWLLCGDDDALALLLSRAVFSWLGLLLIVIVGFRVGFAGVVLWFIMLLSMYVAYGCCLVD